MLACEPSPILFRHFLHRVREKLGLLNMSLDDAEEFVRYVLEDPDFVVVEKLVRSTVDTTKKCGHSNCVVRRIHDL